VVSGPNAGGKTVVVKTAGLLALMAHMGMHVPATRAVFPCLQQVQADIGDEQSLAANLSTFTAHMRNISEMAATVSPPALILIDEVGTGTDPDEGAALAIAIVEYFARAGATTIATTHYNELKAWASQAGGVLNGSVEFDEKTLRPTYRLLVGIAGASSGIEIARRMNLPATIVERAGALLDPEQSRAGEYLKQLKALIDEQTAVNAALEDERHVTAEKFSRLEADFTGRELERRSEFERELSRVIREFTAESRSLIEQIKDRASAARLKREADARAAELRRSAGARLRKQTEAAAVEVRAAPPDSAFPPARKETPAAPELSEDLFEMDDTAQIRERDSVRIKGYSQVGRVESIEDGVYAVLVGSMRMRARREDLQLVRPAAASSRKAELERATTSTGGQSIDQSFTAELNIIGTTVDEATDRVDKFLDEAFLAGAEAVRLVHGHGTGALRRAVAALLTGHPHVERFQSAPANQGGAGATIVELRK
jgi:DNA mismatch repair protein MutS2